MGWLVDLLILIGVIAVGFIVVEAIIRVLAWLMGRS